MKKIIFTACFILLSQSNIIFAEENPTALCQRTMQSLAAIGSQLKHNPNLKVEDLNNIADKQTNNLKLKEFLKSRLIPVLLNKNTEAVNIYIHSKETLNECELLITKN